MSQRKGDAYTFMFASCVCLFCSVVLALAATALKPMKEANVKLDVTANILSAVGYDVAEMKKDPEAAFKRFGEEFNIMILDKTNQQVTRDFMVSELTTLGYVKDEMIDMDEGTLLRRYQAKIGLLARKADKKRDEYDPGYKLLYVHKDAQGNPDSYVVPIDGYGLWDNMKGYLALEPDLNTVKGVTFYEHKETPGLGARVTEQWFQDSFKGKKILNNEGELVSITIAKGKSRGGDHEVDGISGATLTGDGMNYFMLDDLQNYEPYFATLRKSNGRASL